MASFAGPHTAQRQDLSADKCIGLCEQMCSREERLERHRYRDVHKYEEVLGTGKDATFGESTMIKRYQRSSADHELLIPSQIRSIATLQRTITYIEESIMHRSDNMSSAELMVEYLFIWDRYRMIAKDFILQSTSTDKLHIWIDSHERMVRWHCLMQQQMTRCDAFLAHHAQQNLECMNNALKTLLSLYSKCRQEYKGSAANATILQCEGEFTAYYLLMQLRTVGFISSYLRTAPLELLESVEVRQVLGLYHAFTCRLYVPFFRLLQECHPLYISILFPVVAYMRVAALRALTKAGASPSLYPVDTLTELLLFASTEETLEFLAACGIDTSTTENGTSNAVLDKKSMVSEDTLGDGKLSACLSRVTTATSRLEQFPRAHICRGNAWKS